MKKKFLALLLALVMVLAMLPTAALAEEEETAPATVEAEPVTNEGNEGDEGDGDDAADDVKLGSATQITEQGTVETAVATNDSPATVTVTVNPTDALKWYEKNTQIGRNDDGWWIGINIIAPEGITVTKSDTLNKTNEDSTTSVVKFYRRGENGTVWRAWGPSTDGTTTDGKTYMQAWGRVTPEFLKNAEAANACIEYTWYFNWDGNDSTGNSVTTKSSAQDNADVTLAGVDQIFTIRFDPKNVVLEKHETDAVWPEAKIGDACYSLAGAIKAAKDNDTIVVQDDLEVGYTAFVGKKLTVDFGSKTVKLKDGTYTGLFDICAGSDVTLKNGTLERDAATYQAIEVDAYKKDSTNTKGGKLTIASDMTVTSKSVATIYVYEEGSTLNVYGTVTNTDAGYAISENGNQENGSVTINIYDGANVTSARDVAIYIPNTNTVNVAGGTVKGATAIYQKSGTLNITGGTIEATGAKANYSYSGNGCNPTGGALVVDVCNYPGGAPIVNVTGGTFKTAANGGAPVEVYSEKRGTSETVPEEFISGGTFSDKDSIESYIASGKEIAPNGDGTFTVKDTTSVTPPTPPTPSTPTVTTDKNEGTTSTTVKPSVNTKGEVTATVNTSTANALVNKTVKDGTDNAVVEVKPTGSRAVKEVKAELPAKAVANLAEKTDASLTVATPVANVTISNDALAGLSDGAQKIAVTAAVKTDAESGRTVCEVAILKDGKPVDELTGEVKVALPVDEKSAEAGKGLIAVLVNEDGTETIIKKSVLTEDGRMIAVLESGTAAVKYVDNAKIFADETPDWAEDAVRFTSSRRLFLGVSDSEFGADVTMNRAMLVTVLHRLEGEPEAGKNADFQDVEADSWYAASAAWSAENGIVLGTENGFDGERVITRQDLALMLYRYIKAYGSGQGTSGDFSQMGGADDVADYAEEAMRWAVGSGILIGDENNDLAPQRGTTRAEVAVMLMRFVELLTK